MCPNVTCLRWFYAPSLSPHPTWLPFRQAPYITYHIHHSFIYLYGLHWEGGLHHIHQSSAEIKEKGNAWPVMKLFFTYSPLNTTISTVRVLQVTAEHTGDRNLSWGYPVNAPARVINIKWIILCDTFYNVLSTVRMINIVSY